MNYPGYSYDEIARIVAYAISDGNCENGCRRFTDEFQKAAPPTRTVREWKKRFMETLSVHPNSRAPLSNSKAIPQIKKDLIVTSMGDATCTTQRDAARQFNVSLSSVNRIIKSSDVRHFKYKIVQELKETDKPKRLAFCTLILEKQLQDPRWAERIMFSDEATCHLNGTINIHNLYYYSHHNEHRILEKACRSPSVTVWAMVSYDGRLRYRTLFDTMNSDRYCDILNDIVFPTLESVRYNNYVYQQDGASVHWALSVRDLLTHRLPNRWIGRSGPIEWPPRSPDLSINDFYLWAHMRDVIYRTPRAESLQELAQRIELFLNNIDLETIKKTYKCFVRRCTRCVEQNGHHIEHIL